MCVCYFFLIFADEERGDFYSYSDFDKSTFGEKCFKNLEITIHSVSENTYYCYVIIIPRSKHSEKSLKMISSGIILSARISDYNKMKMKFCSGA